MLKPSILFIIAAVLSIQAADSKESNTKVVPPDTVAKELYIQSLYLGQSGKVDSALYYLDLALDTIHDKSAEFGLYPVLRMNQAVYLGAAGYLDSAIRSYRKILSDIDYLDPASIHRIYRSMGVYYRQTSKMDSALACYSKCLELSEKMNDKRLLAETCTNLAVLYHEQNAFDNAKEMADRGYRLASETDNLYTVMQAATVYAEVYAASLPYSGLAPYLEQAFRVAQDLKAAEFMIRVINVVMRTAPKDVVLKYISAGDEIVESFPPLSRVRIVYEFLKATKMYKYGRYATALEIFKRIEELYVTGKMESEPYYYETIRMMGDVYHAIGDFEQSSVYRDKAIGISERLHNESISKLISENAVKNEMNIKEFQIASLERENKMKNRMNLYLAILTVVLFMLIIMFAVYFSLRNKQLKDEAELKNVRSYLDGLEHERTRLAKDLHDGVCSDLLGIGYAIQGAGPDRLPEIAELIETVRQDVRSISHKLMPPRFKNLTLNEALEDYIFQISEKSGKNITFESTVPEEDLRKLSENINYNLYRIVQEMISNSMKHSHAGKIEVVFSNDGSVYRLVYRQYEQKPSDLSAGGSSGIGMDTMNERIMCIGAALSVVESSDSWEYIIEFKI